MTTKSAFIAIAGRANAGKSTLVNFLVGEKIAIVSDKPQTTRTRINGVVTKGDTQYVFIDTPGMHKARNKLSDQMVKAIRDSITDVDCVLFMTDATKKISPIEHNLIERFKNDNSDVILLINKIDLIKDKSELLQLIKQYSELYPFKEIVPISLKNGENTAEIMPLLSGYSKLSPHYFDENLPTDQTEKVWLSEIVREKILRNMNEEIPHGVAVYVESMETLKKKNGTEYIDLGVVIVCEKATHKGMIIGKQGAMLKKIGSEARADMEDYFDCKVNLKIWVKVKEDWRNIDSAIADFGLKSE